MTPQQHQTASRLLGTINGGTDIGDWARNINNRARLGLPVNKDDLKLSRELMQIADKLRKK